MNHRRFGPGMFLTWQRHQRTLQIGARTGIPVIILRTRLRGVPRYLSLVWQTIKLLAKQRPAWVIVQSPSYVLAGVAVTLGRLLTRAIVVDAHNEAVRPYINDRVEIRWLAQFIMRRANAVIVTNDELGRDVRACGGRPIVLPDPLPADIPAGREDLGPGRHVAVVLTYAPDEPVQEVLAAAGTAPAGVTFHLTGDVDRTQPGLRKGAPANVRFTGLLPDAEYWSLLHSVDAVMDLTTMPDCLVCGAYEALAAGVPSILSDNPAGRRIFREAAVFISPDREAIASVLRTFEDRVVPVQAKVDGVAQWYAAQWETWAAVLMRSLAAHEGRQ